MEAALGRQTNNSALGVSLGTVAAACLTAFTLIAQTVALPEPGSRGLLPSSPPSALRQALTLFAPSAGPASVPAAPAPTAPEPVVVEPAVPAPADPSATDAAPELVSLTSTPPSAISGRVGAPADSDPQGRAVGLRRADKRQPAKRNGPKSDARKGRGAARASSSPRSRVPQSRAPGRPHSQASSRGSGGGRSKSYGQKTSRGKANGKTKSNRGFSRGRGRAHGRNGRN